MCLRVLETEGVNGIIANEEKKTNKNAKSLMQIMMEVIMLNVAAMAKLSNIY